jgi:hypothetical protein
MFSHESRDCKDNKICSWRAGNRKQSLERSDHDIDTGRIVTERTIIFVFFIKGQREYGSLCRSWADDQDERSLKMSGLHADNRLQPQFRRSFHLERQTRKPRMELDQIKRSTSVKIQLQQIFQVWIPYSTNLLLFRVT